MSSCKLVKLSDAQTLAHRLMTQHGLSEWTFRFDRAKRRFGACNYTTQTISLSRRLTEINSVEHVRETLLHEIAHALTPGAHHGEAWQAMCVQLGIEPKRLYSSAEVEQPTPRYWLVCHSCKTRIPRHRRSRKTFACKRCCDEKNGGRYSRKYALQLELYSAD